MTFLCKLTSSSKVDKLLRHQISFESEEVWVVAVDSYKHPLVTRMLFRGTVDSCVVHPRDIFRAGLLANATGIFIAHSHPQGESDPSDLDLSFTSRLVQLGRLMEVPILDHLILSPKNYFSFVDKGLIQHRGRFTYFDDQFWKGRDLSLDSFSGTPSHF